MWVPTAFNTTYGSELAVPVIEKSDAGSFRPFSTVMVTNCRASAIMRQNSSRRELALYQELRRCPRSVQTDTSTKQDALPVLRGGDAAPRGAGGTVHAHKCATGFDRDTHGLAGGRTVCEQHKPVCGSATRILSQTGHVCGQVHLRRSNNGTGDGPLVNPTRLCVGAPPPTRDWVCVIYSCINHRCGTPSEVCTPFTTHWDFCHAVCSKIP